MSKEEYFGDWLKLFDPKDFNEGVRNVTSLYKLKHCEPSFKDIFKCFNATPLEKLKVVMLFQDPYFQKGVATGIACGNKKSVKNLSPTLNILKEGAINFEIPHNFINFDPTLESWCEQGVLLLNTALTVEVNKPLSHKMIWRPFISSLLKNLSSYDPGLIYVLWGSEAKSFNKFITSSSKIFKMNHPSYYARNNEKLPPTFFVELNNTIKFYYNQKIKWYEEVFC